MMWPFKKKDKPVQHKDEVTTQYNKLRASVGMAPAENDDYCEAVAWVVVFDLLAPEVAEECKRLPVEEQGLFMMAYATFLTWLAMQSVKSKFPPDSWRQIAHKLQREFSKQAWYKPEIMRKMFHSMNEIRPTGWSKGKHTNVSLGPWVEVVTATNLAGYKLSQSTNLEFILYVAVMSGKIRETIAKMAPCR